MKEKNIILISEQELKAINGGFIVGVAAILIGYACAAAAFIYTMGKDGKSGVSNNPE